jgi:hypothetical protein
MKGQVKVNYAPLIDRIFMTMELAPTRRTIDDVRARTDVLRGYL